jgi:hypothetical protein
LSYDDRGRPIVRITSRRTHTVVVLVDRLDRATLRAARYALTLGANEIWAVHAAVDAETVSALAERWMDQRLPIPLDIIECWDRNVARAIEAYVASGSGPAREVTVVMARRDFPRLRQRLLHDRTSRRIARALAGYAHVDVTAVPYFVGSPRYGPSPVVASGRVE